MADRFLRACRFSLARPSGDSFFGSDVTLTTVTDLRVQFDIEKNLGKEPNNANVIVTNLSQASRQELQKKPLKIVLEAGYVDQLETLFTGDVTWAQSRRNGVDWDTEFQVGDGRRAFRHARLTKSYRKGTPLKRVLEDVAKSMNLRLPAEVLSNSALNKQFAAGFSADGFARDQLTTLLAPAGLTWSIQNGRLQILKDTQAVKKGIVVINQELGMIGNPEMAAPKEKGKPPTLHVESMLRADVSPGGIIELQSRFINGRFKVRRVVHTGDTHGDTWKSEIEARPV